MSIKPDWEKLKRIFAAAAAASLAALLMRGCSIARRAHGGAALPAAEASVNVNIYDDETGQVYQLPLEEYVLRVVAAEMPASFSLEALKAQSVAVRTYTVRRLGEFGGKQCGKGGADVCTASACCQAYRTRSALADAWGSGAQMYFAKLEKAVEATRGLILTYSGEPIEALFHSASGGMTEDAQNVFGADTPYLKSVMSPGEDDIAAQSATLAFTRAQFAAAVNAAFAAAGLDAAQLEAQIEILARSPSGRVLKLRLGGATLSGRQMRSALGLNSTAFTITPDAQRVTITTAGRGHGVGMSQYGAEAMAQRGADYEEILLHYYTGAKIEGFLQ